MNRILIIITLAFLMTGCEGSKARVKGRVVENAQPMVIGSNQAALELTPISPGGEPNQAKMFTAVVNEDGTFTVVASGGELPPGKYQIDFRGYGKLATKYKGIPPFVRDLKAGMNELTLDLAKPD